MDRQNTNKINKQQIIDDQNQKEKQCIQKQNEIQKQQQILQNGNKICQFIITRKRRQCKFVAIKGSKFCAAHCSDQANKIQCPYQKGMFIDAAKFQKHLQICPRIKNKKVQEQSQWFTKGVNLNKQQKTGQALQIDSIDDIDKQILVKVIRKATNLFLKSFKQKQKYFICSTQQQKIQNLTNDHTQAHLLAQAAFKVDLIRDDIIYLQFGAGKGILSYHLAQRVKKQCGKPSKNVLLQRETRRNKFDRFMKDNPYFQRFKSDVSDFDVSKLPLTMAQTAHQKCQTIDIVKQAAQLNQLKIVGVCKHMCGAALDISLRALMKTKMSGCILASCCHHLCSYESYLNTKFFEQNQFSPDELQVLFKISAWGTKSSTIKQHTVNFQKLCNISLEALHGDTKIIIGRISKRLIDLGRAQVLNCQLMRYCSDQITPQNFVIISK